MVGSLDFGLLAAVASTFINSLTLISVRAFANHLKQIAKGRARGEQSSCLLQTFWTSGGSAYDPRRKSTVTEEHDANRWQLHICDDSFKKLDRFEKKYGFVKQASFLNYPTYKLLMFWTQKPE